MIQMVMNICSGDITSSLIYSRGVEYSKYALRILYSAAKF